MSSWRKLRCTKLQVRLDLVLPSGQSFRWRETAPGEWTNVLAGRIWTLKQDDTGLFYRVHQVKKNEESNLVHENILRDYLQLDVDLAVLFKQWSKADPYFAEMSKAFRGVRLLRQDPVETLFGFICSSNNNIPRISGMVEKLCHEYGEKVGEMSGTVYHSFPLISDLAGAGVEDHLRSLGFGYRAKFISQSAKYILHHHDKKWPGSLRNVSYPEAHAALCELPGVGAKVADCVCLMSLDKQGAVPVDTHVWQITSRYYMPHLTKTKSLTSNVYNKIGDFYRQLFGEYAGWAHSVLFTADLKRFQNMQTVEHVKRPFSIKETVEEKVQSSSDNKSSRKKKKMQL